jgi:hypothetical protein
MTVSSPDVDIFDIKAVYDLTGAIPVVKFTNLSSGPNLAALSYWFILKTPSGVVYHEGTEGVPDKNGVWNTEFQIPEQIPEIQSHIDWSGSDYEIIAYAKDSADNIFQTPTYRTRICRPGGNKQGAKSNYGAGALTVLMNCCTGKLFVEDKSSYSYNGLAGTKITKKLVLVYPPDNTDVIPPAFEVNDVNTVEIPVTYNGKNYQLLLDAVYEYDYGNNTFVRIKYKFKGCFDVTCGTDLCVILCGLQKFEQEMFEEGCTSAQRDKWMQLHSKLIRAIAGIMQPLCGINVPALVKEIKDLLGTCTDCESEGGGINPVSNCAVPVDLTVEPLS